ncbi:MAG: 3-dehydroquinate synthase [Planctomycetes bacterium]|nr:3-dehydroquinate synthase [Planctomycetota bacterium]
MSDLRIECGAQSTEVIVRPNVLDEFGSLLSRMIPGPARPQVVVITDKLVGGIYGAAMLSSLKSADFEPLEYRIEPGEASKSLEVLGNAYRFLADHTVARDAVVVALGGGVVSDLAGFVAATWMRGVRFAVCPTTLEANIDACIGGKTGINLPGGKNLIGAFHQPMLVAVDPTCLKTLDDRDVRAGLAESIKHALISSRTFLDWHRTNVKALLALDDALIPELILRNLRIKAKIVEQDTLEQAGVRVLLNFGHTIGHAIEACCEFELRHGECVALGMLAACRLSHSMGLLAKPTLTNVEAILSDFGLPTRLTRRIDAGRVMAAIRHDKKIRGGAQHFVLLEGVGQPVVRDDVPEQQVQEAYESLLP